MRNTKHLLNTALAASIPPERSVAGFRLLGLVTRDWLLAATSKIVLSLIAVVWGVLFSATGAVAQTIVYDNTDCDAENDGLLISQQLFEFGDQITLEGSARSLTAFSVGMAMIDNGDLSDDTARIRIYANDGPVVDNQQSPGTVLYDSGPIDISTNVGGPFFDLEVFPGIVAPASTVTWTVEFGGIAPVPPPNPQQGFLVICQLPSIGMSDDFHWTHTTGWTKQSAPTFINNFRARMTAEVASTLDFFDDAVNAGLLVGSGSGNSANGRRNALRNMLQAAEDLIASGDILEACEQLEAALKKTDGVGNDFVTGEAAAELAAQIEQDLIDLDCP